MDNPTAAKQLLRIVESLNENPNATVPAARLKDFIPKLIHLQQGRAAPLHTITMDRSEDFFPWRSALMWLKNEPDGYMWSFREDCNRGVAERILQCDPDKTVIYVFSESKNNSAFMGKYGCVHLAISSE